MFTIIMSSWGGIRRPLIEGIETFKEAHDICESMDWIYCPDGGYVWDLEIDEDVI